MRKLTGALLLTLLLTSAAGTAGVRSVRALAGSAAAGKLVMMAASTAAAALLATLEASPPSVLAVLLLTEAAATAAVKLPKPDAAEALALLLLLVAVAAATLLPAVHFAVAGSCRWCHTASWLQRMTDMPCACTERHHSMSDLPEQ
jgi:hypothetical protein